MEVVAEQVVAEQVVPLDDVTVPSHHRAIKPWSLERIKQSMKEHGYNMAYPVVIEPDGTLVDGRHRLEAARALGLPDVPFILKPEGASRIRFSLQCNADGQLCQPDDVFDLAELCAGLAAEGWTGEQIARNIGWNTKQQVEQYVSIKADLHPAAWMLARYASTRNGNSVDGESPDIVDTESTIVDWKESHFRALLRHLAYTDGDRVVMRAQMKAVREILDRWKKGDKKVTAGWIGEIAQRYAWHVELEKYIRDHVAREVGVRDRIQLLQNVRKGVFGDEPSDKNMAKFVKAIATINERALGVKLYQDDALQRIPLLADKSVSLVVADPPYNVTGEEWDSVGTAEEYLEWLARWLLALRPKLADDYHLFLFCSPEYQASIEGLLRRDDWPLKSRIIWSHRNMSMGRDVAERFICNWEMVFHCGTHSLNWSPDWTDERLAVQEHASPQSNFKSDPKLHPASKPLKLIKLFVAIGSKPGDFVLDPFAGGGTTGQACREIGQRRCLLVERDDAFCTIIESHLDIKREKAVTNE